jgi:hypothetical protein
VQPDDYNSDNCYLPGIQYQGIQYLRVEHPFGELAMCTPYLASIAFVGSSDCVILYNEFLYDGRIYCPSSPSGAFAAP